MKNRVVTYCVVLFSLCWGGLVMAQSNTGSVVLNNENMEIAEDLRDILEQLEKLAHDYQQYFSEDNNHYATRYKRALIKILINIDKGEYVNDIDLLLTHIDEFKNELQEREQIIRSDPEQKKFYRNVRSLRTQLELLEEFIHDDLDKRLKDNQKSLPQISAYLEQEKKHNDVYNKYIEQVVDENRQMWEELEKHSDDLNALLKETYKIELTKEEVEEIKQAVTEAKEAVKLYKLTDPDRYVIPDVPDVPNVTVLYRSDSLNMPLIITGPTPPAPPTSPKTYKMLRGNVLTQRSLLDSLVVASSEEMIFINNLTGDLEIKGHNSNKVIATVEVQVMADSYDEANDFIDQIEIKLLSNEDGIYITPHFPDLNTAEQKILKSKMTIYVPVKNKVICETSFGNVTAKSLRNGINMEARHCQLYFSDITGGVKIINSSGVSKLYQVNGSIDLSSSLGPVVLKACDGDMEISNSYSEIDLSNCQGTARISNSGKTTISDHIGRIDIQNNNGAIRVSDHRGDLIAKTSFKPITIVNVQGNIEVTNVNSSITVNDAVGKVQANNKFGSIDLSEISGPVALYNNSGSISMVVDEFYKGSSEINSDYGSVNLVLNPNSNIFVSANSEGGSISSAFNSRITQNNLGSSTKLTLGKGNNALKVTGTNSVITIAEGE